MGEDSGVEGGNSIESFQWVGRPGGNGFRARLADESKRCNAFPPIGLETPARLALSSAQEEHAWPNSPF
ncbi:hypothetical protein Sinac_2830 [Singulisphaera acidiphila DSM 18658]|uniref:Uncharacterized protein n=1 Tax=Singulisphaera acidiphila (strain ATCC BAA-1392 / DSM 18658 / VKM B-2454 / MOB10) TaxID=886293 RepID=L0DD01_SINAD|nr:hypothetical protein Sinac_2830 [Singulisphaera acidiphila DSM 18658]